jgi:hypothetical protein
VNKNYLLTLLLLSTAACCAGNTGSGADKSMPSASAAHGQEGGGIKVGVVIPQSGGPSTIFALVQGHQVTLATVNNGSITTPVVDFDVLPAPIKMELVQSNLLLLDSSIPGFVVHRHIVDALLASCHAKVFGRGKPE